MAFRPASTVGEMMDVSQRLRNQAIENLNVSKNLFTIKSMTIGEMTLGILGIIKAANLDIQATLWEIEASREVRFNREKEQMEGPR